MDWKKKLKWLRKRLTWNYKYAIGKWDNMGSEADRYNAIVSLIRRCAIPEPRILDLGCGYGALMQYLKPEDYSYCLGVDLSDTAIMKARKQKYPKCDFRVGDIHRFTPPGTFDIILFNEVLYYLDNRTEVAVRYAGYAQPNGYMIVSLYDLKESIVADLSQEFTFVETRVVHDNDRHVVWGINLFKLFR